MKVQVHFRKPDKAAGAQLQDALCDDEADDVFEAWAAGRTETQAA